MDLRVAPAESLIDILDRVLDKSIVVEAWVRLTLAGVAAIVDGTTIGSFVVSSAEVYEGYGEEGHKKELLGHLFPYWRKDLWTK
jgi:gas vesicle structural protein